MSQDFGTALCFVLGAAVSALTGWAGMSLAVRGNVRCAAAAVHGLNPALRVAFDTGKTWPVLHVLAVTWALGQCVARRHSQEP